MDEDLSSCETFQHTLCTGEWRYRDCQWNKYTSQTQLEISENFQFRAEDLVVATFPRSGTTLTQEIIWQLKNLSIIKRGETYGSIDDRFDFLEFNSKYYGENLEWTSKILENKIGGRLIKTHLPLAMLKANLMAAKPKIVYVLRNPKDTASALYHFYKGLPMYGPWPGEWNEFADKIFLGGLTMCGDWFTCARDWLEARRTLNIHVVLFENLLREPERQIKSLAEFLDIEVTPEQVETVMLNTKFDTMQSNKELNVSFETGFKFLRKGQIGNWKVLFTEEQSKRFDEAVNERFKGIEDLPNFEYGN